MIALKTFTEDDFEIFKSWISTEAELYQFAGGLFEYPVTDEQLLNYIGMADLRPLKIVLTKSNEPIGHCELNYQNGKRRLSRILIGDKRFRGQGLGQQVVKKMTQLFFEDRAVQEVDLNVFDWNKNAIRCYEKVGFRIRESDEPKFILNDKETWSRVNMVLTRIHEL